MKKAHEITCAPLPPAIGRDVTGVVSRGSMSWQLAKQKGISLSLALKSQSMRRLALRTSLFNQLHLLRQYLRCCLSQFEAFETRSNRTS